MDCKVEPGKSAWCPTSMPELSPGSHTQITDDRELATAFFLGGKKRKLSG